MLLVDPLTGAKELLTDVGRVNGLGFAPDGGSLTIIGGDGTIRLWDVMLGESLGVVWTGSGGGGASPWYDVAADSVWVASSGFLLEIPLDPAAWVQIACDVVGRDLTADEWARFVHADGVPVSACTANEAAGS